MELRDFLGEEEPFNGIAPSFTDTSVKGEGVGVKEAGMGVREARSKVMELRDYLDGGEKTKKAAPMTAQHSVPGRRLADVSIAAVKELQEQRAALLGETNASVISSWDISQLVGTNGMDASQLWVYIKHKLELMVEECWFTRGGRCEEVGAWSTVHTVLGICYQYRVHKPVGTSGIFNNMYLRLKDTEQEAYNDDRGFKILIHDPRDDPVIDLRTHGTTLEEGWGKDDLTYDEVSEEIAYDAIALLCDIGGTLGLLLGASVLTFIEFLEVLWMKLLRRWRA
ncbi:Acid-sensing ion channel 4-like [Homarus americanus]|uniref:Acid-sensing ion channel 4-like n=1 Tax=Homarus americanus TaxID=6706 RepID=A0A8J5N683_HOMAM|nr:Acid-sensing ion channel 4-like [Homarus americanus]